ncbi:MAG TPA: ABC transporter substrate-binding protein [Acidimicrobiales bacterium]|nr:ABC transporter substrate-binding protein [Acidimicrobiales bacterium]
MNHLRARKAMIGALATLVMLPACADDSDQSTSNTENSAPSTSAPAPSTSKQPKIGGTVTFASYIMAAGLDPLVISSGNGAVGGSEMLAVYDAIVRFDPATGKYENRTSESLTPNADFTVWTLRLKPGIVFSDGTPYDAAAVVFNLNRHRSGQPGAPPCAEIVACPRNTRGTATYVAPISNLEVTGPLTVTITLRSPWSGFPFVLATLPGQIASPTALKKCAGAQPPAQCAFNLSPVGAGPFIVSSFKAGESIVMTRNPTYFGGQVPLDEIRFVPGGDANALSMLDTGTAQAVYARDAQVVADAKAKKYVHIDATDNAGSGLLFNTASGATADVNVRRAITAAVDPRVVNDRVFGGQGVPGSELFKKGFPWLPDVKGPAYDPEAARRYVAEAKQAGWNGSVRIISTNLPVGINTTVALDAMLKAVGIEPQIENLPAGESATRAAQGDFDIQVTGFGLVNDEGTYAILASNFNSTDGRSASKFKSPALDTALAEIATAKTDAERVSGYGKFATEITAKVPMMPLVALPVGLLHTAKLQGVQSTVQGVMIFSQAWLDQ